EGGRVHGELDVFPFHQEVVAHAARGYQGLLLAGEPQEREPATVTTRGRGGNDSIRSQGKQQDGGGCYFDAPAYPVTMTNSRTFSSRNHQIPPWTTEFGHCLELSHTDSGRSCQDPDRRHPARRTPQVSGPRIPRPRRRPDSTGCRPARASARRDSAHSFPTRRPCRPGRGTRPPCGPRIRPDRRCRECSTRHRRELTAHR